MGDEWVPDNVTFKFELSLVKKNLDMVKPRYGGWLYCRKNN